MTFDFLLPFALQISRCYNAIQAGAVTFLGSLSEMLTVAIVNKLMKKFASRVLKCASALGMMVTIIIFGYLIRTSVGLICLSVILVSINLSF